MRLIKKILFIIVLSPVVLSATLFAIALCGMIMLFFAMLVVYLVSLMIPIMFIALITYPLWKNKDSVKEACAPPPGGDETGVSHL